MSGAKPKESVPTSDSVWTLSVILKQCSLLRSRFLEYETRTATPFRGGNPCKRTNPD